MADSNLGPRWRHLARVLRGEKVVTAAAARALQELLGYVDRALRSSGYDAGVLSATAAGWPKIVAGVLLPPIEDVFAEAFKATSRGGLDPQDFGTRHIEAVTNRLAGVPDEVFDAMRLAIETGRREQESIPEIAARVDSLLTDQERWTGRATTIARTEVIGANNAGGWSAAGGVATALGVDGGQVVKEWLATSDGRTRPTHADADGQQVLGMDTPFNVGGYDLQFAGDSSGPAEEVVNCRCTVLYLMPGDPAYPTELSDGGRSTGNGAIPADPVAAPDVAASSTSGTPGEVTAPAEPVVDAGPQNDMERMARSLTLGELVMETKRGSARARSVARAELVRRGITAAAGDQEDDVADSENRNGVVLVALPAASDQVQEIGPEEKHATLLYFGDLPDSDGDNPNPVLTDDAGFRTLLSQAAAIVAGEIEPFAQPVTGVESLGDDGARVWMLGDGPLAAIREEVQEVDDEITGALNAVEQYPSYTPHVTIGYVDPEATDLPGTDEAAATGQVSDDELDQATAVESITFDRLALWWGTERTEWPLGAPDTEETDMPDTETPEAVAAAAGDPVPAGTTPLAAGDPAPAVDAEQADSDQFHGTMMVEDTQTGDGRAFAAGSVEWEGLLPMPLGWQVEDAPGHDGSVIVGRIDTITRVGNEIQYEGTWDLDGYGWEPRRMVEGQFLRGLSVDVDDVEADVVAEDGSDVDSFDFMMGGEGVLVVTRGRIRSAALCRVPAFAPLDSPGSVFIANGPRPAAAAPADGAPAEEPTDTPPVPEEAVAAAALVAAATRADHPAAPATPPAEWFSSPNLDRPTPVTVTDDGRVFGHIASWGTCHIGIQGQCVTPPESLAAYAYFLTGETETTAGRVATGVLTMDTGHAPLSLRAAAAAAHYDNTGTAWADVAAGEDEHGIWIAGAVRSSVTPEKVEVIRAAGALSGDWRKIGAGLELVAALAVNVPGFPLPRISVAASASMQTALVASGVVPHTVPVDANELGAVVASAVRRALRAERAMAAYDETARRARARRVERAATLIERNR